MRITIELMQRDYELLDRIALAEYRTISQQAAYLLRDVLQQASDGVIDCKPLAEKLAEPPAENQAAVGV